MIEYAKYSTWDDTDIGIYRYDVKWPEDSYENAHDYVWYYNQLYNDPNGEYAGFWEGYTWLRERGIKVMLSTWFAVPRVLVPGHTDPWAGYLDPNKYPEYAHFWTAVVRAAIDKGYAVEGIDFTNETDGGWSTQMVPGEYPKVTKRVGQELVARGVSQALIVGPDTFAKYNLNAYVDGLVADKVTSDQQGIRSALSYMRAIATHSWDNSQGLEVYGTLAP